MDLIEMVCFEKVPTGCFKLMGQSESHYSDRIHGIHRGGCIHCIPPIRPIQIYLEWDRWAGGLVG